ncbi:SH3-domain-containing protein [Auriculariales sp. MPI-PUGE-AT-0066]|nr:SH3-domain-containing protein [Auriculariales sp. MPI-PUGE-AT-0066]
MAPADLLRPSFSSCQASNMGSQEAYLSHIVSRIEADVQFLVDQGTLSAADAQEISFKLAATNSTASQVTARPATSGFQSVAAAFKRTVAPAPSPTAPNLTPAMPTPAPVAAPSSPPPAGPVMLRALWDWEDDNDLSFKAGDRIELIEETSPEWWTGRMGSRTGLFPSNYVEKLPDHPKHINRLSSQHMSPSASYKASNLGSYNGSSGTNSVGLAPPTVDEKKKSKMGKLGGTMAKSAAGGVGFGAGAAIGGGLVRAIF